MSIAISIKILFLLIEIVNGLRTSDPNVCPRFVMKRKSNGQYGRLLEMSCCQDYIEMDNECQPCSAGYFGQNCTEPCSQLPNRYGVQCKQICECVTAKTCDPILGCVCQAGFEGQHCEKECDLGRYGVDCTQTCQCSVHAHCNAVTGHCACFSGWTGQYCNEVCSYPFYGDNCMSTCSCSTNQTCHHVTGECSCQPGYTGPDCATECSQGTYGINCEEVCTCVNGMCNPASGRCQCDAGFVGRNCDKECPKFTYGVGCNRTCGCSSDYEGCDKVTGQCLCRPGYHGKTCNQLCEHGYYGANCQQQCDCSEMSVCDKYSGTCQCQTGWTGTSCNQRCPTGTYGSDCANKCDCGHCNHVTGECQENQTGQSIYPVIGSVIGGIAFIGILVGFAGIVFKRRKKSNLKRNGSDPLYVDINDYAEIADVGMLPDSKNPEVSDVRPQVKSRQPTTKRQTNQYMSITDVERESKLVPTVKVNGKGCEADTDYVGLLKTHNSVGYHDLTRIQRLEPPLSDRKSVDSESGYLKPMKITNIADSRNPKPNTESFVSERVDQKPNISDNNAQDEMISPREHHASGSSVESESGYLKPKEIKQQRSTVPRNDTSTGFQDGLENTDSTHDHGLRYVVIDYDYPKKETDINKRQICGGNGQGQDSFQDGDYDVPKDSKFPTSKPNNKAQQENVNNTCDTPGYASKTYDSPTNVHGPYDTPPNDKGPVNATYDTPINVNARYDTPINVNTTYDTPININATYDKPSNVNGTYSAPTGVDATYDTPKFPNNQ